ncbi:MAG: NAD(P)/FAD-dependent oxidoreductase [Chroococcidiopsidaceae cyanobacterium CP_BM_RX_35]|nr:NAD(P)/FAD-dependent oxidoreductase [Chroococcidiopsidaceae cyanobacterium CP_BM_RX_35]
MAVDYDVVIIGGSPTGRYAAIAAAQLGAIVALVEPIVGNVESSQRSAGGGSGSFPEQAQGIGVRGIETAITPHALSQIGQITQQLGHASQLGIHFLPTDAAEHCGNSVRWVEARQWASGVVSNLEEQQSLSVLASTGVDVIVGNGQFQPSPHLTFAVNERNLRARAYLLATGCRPAIPNIEGLQTTGYLTAAELWQRLNSQELPKKWAILGGDPVGIQMAQAMNRLGFNITLIVRSSHILPREELEAVQLVQATLEAEGVRLLTATPVTRVLQMQEKKLIQVGNETIEVDEILVAGGQVSNIEALNLAAVGVTLHRRSLRLNEKLQTTNPRIYACGNANGGYFANIANYEARIALKNALFFPLYKVNYRQIPWGIFSDPILARVGLTEVQARRQYTANQILVLQQYFKTIAAAQLRIEMTGICKLIARRNGEILGATLVGPQAGELIQVIALAMSQRLKVGAIAQLAAVYPTMSEILEQTAALWHQQRLTNNTRWQDFLESFFNLRRAWS